MDLSSPQQMTDNNFIVKVQDIVKNLLQMIGLQPETDLVTNIEELRKYVSTNPFNEQQKNGSVMMYIRKNITLRSSAIIWEQVVNKLNDICKTPHMKEFCATCTDRDCKLKLIVVQVERIKARWFVKPLS